MLDEHNASSLSGILASKVDRVGIAESGSFIECPNGSIRMDSKVKVVRFLHSKRAVKKVVQQLSPICLRSVIAPFARYTVFNAVSLASARDRERKHSRRAIGKRR